MTKEEYIRYYYERAKQRRGETQDGSSGDLLWAFGLAAFDAGIELHGLRATPDEAFDFLEGKIKIALVDGKAAFVPNDYDATQETEKRRAFCYDYGAWRKYVGA